MRESAINRNREESDDAKTALQPKSLKANTRKYEQNLLFIQLPRSVHRSVGVCVAFSSEDRYTSSSLKKTHSCVLMHCEVLIYEILLQRRAKNLLGNKNFPEILRKLENNLLSEIVPAR